MGEPQPPSLLEARGVAVGWAGRAVLTGVDHKLDGHKAFRWSGNWEDIDWPSPSLLLIGSGPSGERLLTFSSTALATTSSTTTALVTASTRSRTPGGRMLLETLVLLIEV